jgi:glycosyltransferase involved in cell wall biosynthesis
MNLADVCINTFPVSEMTRDIFPGKMVQFIACGRATVATPLPGIKTLLPGESHGVVYAGSADEMAADVVLLLKSPERRRQLGLAGAAYVKQNHDYRIIARQLETILQELIKEKRNESKRVQK